MSKLRKERSDLFSNSKVKNLDRKLVKKSSKTKNTSLYEFNGLVGSNKLNLKPTKEELIRKISSTSIKTNSKILNDVLCDLSSLSSETILSNIESSNANDQRIKKCKKRQKGMHIIFLQLN